MCTPLNWCGSVIFPQHVSAYEGLIQGAKGSTGEKKLAPSFITKFFRYFPSLQDAATDAILDLIEDEDPHVSDEMLRDMLSEM